MTQNQYKKVNKIYAKVEGIDAEVDALLHTLRSKYDNMSEANKDSDRGERLSNTISALEDASSAISSVLEELDNATSGYDEYQD